MHDDEIGRVDQLEQQLLRLGEEYQSLSARLDDADRRARSWRASLCVVVLAIAFTVVTRWSITSQRPDIITTRWLMLVDKSGNRRADLLVTEEGMTTLAFYGQDKQTLLQISTRPDGGTNLAMYGATGNRHVVLGHDPGGIVGLGIYDSDGRKKIGVGINRIGMAGMEFLDQDGKIRIEGAVTSDNSAGLAIFDSQGKPTFQAPPR